MKKFNFYFTLVIAVPLILSLFGGSAQSAPQSEQVIKLTFSSAFAPTHPMGVAEQAWIKKIENESNGRVQIRPFWSESLIAIKESCAELAKGTADLAYIVPTYTPAGFDIHKNVGAFYFGAKDLETEYNISKEILAKFPQFLGELSNAKVLGYGSTTPYHLLTTRKAVRTIKDLAGLQLKCLPSHMEPLKELGASGLMIPMPDTYVSLQRNTIGGLLGPLESLKSFKLAEVIKHVTYLNLYNGHTSYYAMNLNKWNSLPTDIQKIFENNVDFVSRERDKNLLNADEDGLKLAKASGTNFYTLPDADLKIFYDAWSREALKGAKVLDAKGLPGTQIYTESRRLVEKYK